MRYATIRTLIFGDSRYNYVRFSEAILRLEYL